MPKYKVFAAIDFGSTGISMKIAEISKQNGIKIIHSAKYNVSCGREVYTVGKISYQTVNEICGCFENLLGMMKSYGADDYICYATTAVREAANSEYIIDQINIRTGIKVNIISNSEERFLHNKAFALSCGFFDDVIKEGISIVDISSGSVQISAYRNSKLEFSQNIGIGALRVLEMLSDVSRGTELFSGVLEEYLATVINNYMSSFYKNPSYKNFAAFGNQTGSIKRICGVNGDVLTSEQLDEAYKILSSRSVESISDEFDIPYTEAQLLLPSVLIYRIFMKRQNSKSVLMPDISLTDGICVSYMENNKLGHTKHIFTNDIISSAEYYAGKYDVNTDHYKKLIDFSTVIFNSLSKKFGLSKRDLTLLTVAAIFSDTGFYINVNDYNKYSYDIVKANSILGLSSREQEIISFVVLFQNGVFRFNDYNSLTKGRKLLVSKLAAILCLAKSLDTEYIQKINTIKSVIKKGELIITAETNKDITLESWQFSRSREFFEEVFGIKAYLKK